MQSPQSLSFLPLSNSEDELPKALNVPLNAKEVMRHLKYFSALAVLQSKINFLYTTILLSLDGITTGVILSIQSINVS